MANTSFFAFILTTPVGSVSRPTARKGNKK
nr:MAG TPA: hypothetical protein [Caudoviricetes sp.]